VNVIRIIDQPGVVLELRTADPLPSSGYAHLAVIAEAGASLAAALTGEERSDGD
jgi:hypothetical protein